MITLLSLTGIHQYCNHKISVSVLNGSFWMPALPQPSSISGAFILKRCSASPVRTDWVRKITRSCFVLCCIKAGAAAAAHTSNALLLFLTAAQSHGSSPGWWSHFFSFLHTHTHKRDRCPVYITGHKKEIL